MHASLAQELSMVVRGSHALRQHFASHVGWTAKSCVMLMKRNGEIVVCGKGKQARLFINN